MESNKPIVVGYDASLSAQYALRWALVEATRRAARIDIVYALHWPPELMDMVTGTVDRRIRQGAQLFVERAREDALARQPLIPVTASVQIGHPAAVLCGLSADAQLIVLGVRGRGGFTGMLAGSTAVAVAGHASCPVVVVRHAAEPHETRPIAVGVDDGDHGELALRFAFETASRGQIPLTAVHAWPIPLPDRHTPDFDRAQHLAEAETAEYHVIRDVVDRVAKEFPSVIVSLQVVPGSKTAALLDAAELAQLLVIGARGEDGLPTLGPVELRLINHASCAVAIVRSAQQ